VQWVNGAGSVLWPHDKGPLMAYMAACQKTDCSDDPTTLDFFKIAEEGQTTPGGSVWAEEQLYEGLPIKVYFFVFILTLALTQVRYFRSLYRLAFHPGRTSCDTK